MDCVGKLHFALKYDPEMEGLVVKVLEARDLPVKDITGSSDPYVKVYLLPDRKKKYQTKVHRKNLNPVFNETFIFRYKRISLLQIHIVKHSYLFIYAEASGVQCMVFNFQYDSKKVGV